MKILQFSDTHLLAEGALAYGRVDTEAALRRAAAHMRDLAVSAGGVDAVIVTGDLTDKGEPDAYARFRALAVDLGAPLYALPGNHDARDAMRAAFAGDGYLPPSGRLDFEIALGDLLAICLDDIIPGEGGGSLTDAQLSALDTRIAAHAPKPVALFLHHPPAAMGIAHMDQIGLANGGALAEIAGRHINLRLVACGHLHRMMSARLGHASLIVAPSPAHALHLDLRPDAPLGFADEPGAVALHCFEGEDLSSVTTHFSLVGPWPGPHSFGD